jgi:hypothetical protein
MPPAANPTPSALVSPLAPPPWRPFRTLLPVSLILIASSAIGVALFLLLIWYASKAPFCAELVALLCAAASWALASIGTIAVTLVMSYRLLRRRVGNVWSLILLGYLSAGALTSLVYRWLPLPLVAYLALSVLVLLGCFVFFDWLLNAASGSKRSKVAVAGAITFVLLALGFFPQGGSGVALTYTSQQLQKDIEQSKMTFLVPPPGSAYPQPYSIAPNSDKDGRRDYALGAYFGIDTGPQNGTDLYEYKYTDDIDPLKDCGKISSSLVAEWDNQTTCKVVATLASGTKVYAPAVEHPINFFIIKQGTAVTYVPPDTMTTEQAYDFLDHLQPLEVPSLLKTLHQKNPQEY